MVKVTGKERVVAIIKDSTGKIKNIITGSNIVTNAGDEHYARMIVGEESNIGSKLYLRLGTGDSNPTKDDTDVNTFVDNSGKLLDDDFPKRNYTEEENDGDVKTITYRFYYPAGELEAAGIKEGAIVNDPDNPTVALNHFLFDEAFDVTSEDNLVVLVNHSFIGI
jgi:hypothetical protein